MRIDGPATGWSSCFPTSHSWVNERRFVKRSRSGRTRNTGFSTKSGCQAANGSRWTNTSTVNESEDTAAGRVPSKRQPHEHVRSLIANIFRQCFVPEAERLVQEDRFTE